MKVGDTVVTIKRETLKATPHPRSPYPNTLTRRLSYGRGVEAGVVINEDGTAVAYRQINGARIELPAPDHATAVVLLMVIHQEIKAACLEGVLTLEKPEAELLDIYKGYGPRLAAFTEPPAPSVIGLAGYRGQLLKAE